MKKYILSILASLGLCIPGAKSQDSIQIDPVSGFDFIPGNNIIFYDNFYSERIGQFPDGWLSNGSGKLVLNEKYEGNWLKMTGAGIYMPIIKEDFTSFFSVEFDLIPQNKFNEETESMALSIFIGSADLNTLTKIRRRSTANGIKIEFDNWLASYAFYTDGEYTITGKKDIQLKKEVKYHIAISISEHHLKIYLDQKKILDAVGQQPENCRYNFFQFEINDESQPMISSVRVTTGKNDLRDKMKQGRLISYGIYFEPGTSQLTILSFGTLNEIGLYLQQNPDINLRIDCHTDSSGKIKSQLALSKKRATAVKLKLVSFFKIKSMRLKSYGHGAAFPIVPNTNAVNKAKNERFEFIFMDDKSGSSSAEDRVLPIILIEKPED